MRHGEALAQLYEALTGALPFRGAPLLVLLAKQHEVPRRPGELAEVPADLDALCLQLLAIEPAARLEAAAALAAFAPDAIDEGRRALVGVHDRVDRDEVQELVEPEVVGADHGARVAGEFVEQAVAGEERARVIGSR